MIRLLAIGCVLISALGSTAAIGAEKEPELYTCSIVEGPKAQSSVTTTTNEELDLTDAQITRLQISCLQGFLRASEMALDLQMIQPRRKVRAFLESNSFSHPEDNLESSIEDQATISTDADRVPISEDTSPDKMPIDPEVDPIGPLPPAPWRPVYEAVFLTDGDRVRLISGTPLDVMAPVDPSVGPTGPLPIAPWRIVIEGM